MALEEEEGRVRKQYSKGNNDCEEVELEKKKEEESEGI